MKIQDYTIAEILMVQYSIHIMLVILPMRNNSPVMQTSKARSYRKRKALKQGKQ